MKTKTKMINGISSVSLITNKESKFSEAYKFYASLGLRVVKNYNKHTHLALTNQYLNLGISNDSVREIWLEAFELQDLDSNGNMVPLQELNIYSGDHCESYNEGTLVKLRLTDQEIVESPTEFVFFSTDKKQIVDKFGGDELTDPLGNKISISDKPRVNSDKSFSSPQEFIDYQKQMLSATAVTPQEPQQKDTDKKKKIAVMTSGGDAPGMNPAVRAVVRASLYYGCDAFAIYEGYEGLVNDYIKKMDWSDVRSFLGFGGTNIGTARCPGFRERKGRVAGARNMIKNGIDALVVIGGDGSLTGADLFRQEWLSLVDELVDTKVFTEDEVKPYRHLNVVGLVGSIDNDMSSTDATIGAYSSLERITEMVDYIDATAHSHSRAFVVEVMGRHCGWLGLMSGLATGADFIFIPERPPKNGKWQDELKDVCSRHRLYGKRNTTVIVAEGAIDDELNPITSDQVKDVLVELGLDTRITTLGHVQRGGTAVAYDRMLATLQGLEAVKAVLESTPDTPSPIIGIVGNKLTREPLVKAVELTKEVATSIEAKNFDKAMGLRDTGFAEAYHQYLSTSIYDQNVKLNSNKSSKPLNIGVIHIGASSSGLNAATRAITLYCLSQGHKIYGIQNGFQGLIKSGSITELSWLDVENWYNKGGSEIGTNRSLPEENYGQIAYYLQKYDLNGLIIIGGFESFTALNQLNSQKKNYPIFNIPMVVIPATVSNNVPGTEYSLGSDTCLNQLVKYCDAVKQSASSTRRRVFVVEVQGGNSGYIASLIGLLTGAISTYVPEEKITLRKIQEDLQLLTEVFANDRGQDRNGKMIIRNEKASDIYSTELISDIILESCKGRFETRTAIPGHVQQGFTPSSMDRIMATNFGIKACQFIETQDQQHMVIGLVGAKIHFSEISKVYNNEANVSLRKSNVVHWDDMIKASEILSGRLLLRQNRN